MKIYDIINAKPILDFISKNKTLPTRIAYKLYTLLTELTPVLEFFDQKNKELFLKYGEEDGENIVIPESNRKDFYKEYDELTQLDCDKEINKIDISLDVDLEISPADFFLLEPFFNFVE